MFCVLTYNFFPTFLYSHGEKENQLFRYLLKIKSQKWFYKNDRFLFVLARIKFLALKFFTCR